MMRPKYRFHEWKPEKEKVKMLVSKDGTPEEKTHPVAQCDHCGQVRIVADPSECVTMIREDADE